MTDGQGGRAAAGELVISPPARAAYHSLALEDFIERLERRHLPVPQQVRDDAALYKAWSHRGGAAPLEEALVATLTEEQASAEEQASLLTYKQVAHHLAVKSPTTVRRLVKSGALRGVSVGDLPRVRRDDLAAYISSLDCDGPRVTTRGDRPSRAHAGRSEDDEEGSGASGGDDHRA